MSRWSKIIEKSATLSKEIQVSILQETSEKARHHFNTTIAFLGLYVAVLALGYTSILLHIAFLLLLTATLTRYFYYRKLLGLVENITLGDPPLKLAEKIKDNAELIGDLAIIALLLLIAWIIALKF